MIAAGITLTMLTLAMPTTANAIERSHVENGVTIIQNDESEASAFSPTSLLTVINYYESKLDFWTNNNWSNSFNGKVRWYGGSTVGIEMTCHYVAESSDSCDTHFSVELHREDGSYIGSAAFPRNGYNKAEWTNVGPGNYYFRFVKCGDNSRFASNLVKMYSYV